ncbi:MAG: RsmD family RNA methyltransferase, partial [Bacteroidota bacterium]
HALDLTCGLGVDSLYLSQNFESVTSIEANPVLADIATHNFGLLNRSNIQVIHDTAETFLQNRIGPIFDLIYIDPSRRNAAGKRVHSLE